MRSDSCLLALSIVVFIKKRFVNDLILFWFQGISMFIIHRGHCFRSSNIMKIESGWIYLILVAAIR